MGETLNELFGKDAEPHVFVLEPHNGECTYWHEISEKELAKWLLDGSIHPGTLVVWPAKVMVGKEKTELELVTDERF